MQRREMRAILRKSQGAFILRVQGRVRPARPGSHVQGSPDASRPAPQRQPAQLLAARDAGQQDSRGYLSTWFLFKGKKEGKGKEWTTNRA